MVPACRLVESRREGESVLLPGEGCKCLLYARVEHGSVSQPRQVRVAGVERPEFADRDMPTLPQRRQRTAEVNRDVVRRVRHCEQSVVDESATDPVDEFGRLPFDLDGPPY